MMGLFSMNFFSDLYLQSRRFRFAREDMFPKGETAIWVQNPTTLREKQLVWSYKKALNRSVARQGLNIFWVLKEDIGRFLEALEREGFPAFWNPCPPERVGSSSYGEWVSLISSASRSEVVEALSRRGLDSSQI